MAMMEDAVYNPKSGHRLGIMQKCGECMVAEDVPATMIAINIVSNGTGITRFEYAHAFGGGDPL